MSENHHRLMSRLIEAIKASERRPEAKPIDHKALVAALLEWLTRNPHLADTNAEGKLVVSEPALYAFFSIRNEDPKILKDWYELGILDRRPYQTARLSMARRLDPAAMDRGVSPGRL